MKGLSARRAAQPAHRNPAGQIGFTLRRASSPGLEAAPDGAPRKLLLRSRPENVFPFSFDTVLNKRAYRVSGDIDSVKIINPESDQLVVFSHGTGDKSYLGPFYEDVARELKVSVFAPSYFNHGWSRARTGPWYHLLRENYGACNIALIRDFAREIGEARGAEAAGQLGLHLVSHSDGAIPNRFAFSAFSEHGGREATDPRVLSLTSFAGTEAVDYPLTPGETGLGQKMSPLLAWAPTGRWAVKFLGLGWRMLPSIINDMLHDPATCDFLPDLLDGQMEIWKAGPFTTGYIARTLQKTEKNTRHVALEGTEFFEAINNVPRPEYETIGAPVFAKTGTDLVDRIDEGRFDPLHMNELEEARTRELFYPFFLRLLGELPRGLKVLQAVGESDKLRPAAYQNNIHRVWKRAGVDCKLHVVDGAGHLPLEQYETWRDLLLAHLRRAMNG